MKILFFLVIGIIVCYSGISEKCVINSDCKPNNLCINNLCHHESISIIDSREAFTFLIIILGSALSNAGGIGGGGIYVSILIFILNFYYYEAIPISKLMTFSGALISFMLNFKLRHPSRGTNSIDYNIAIIILPFMLYGTLIGIIFNKILLSSIIFIPLTILVYYNTYKTCIRINNEYLFENEQKLIKSNSEQGTSDRKNLSMNDKLNRIEIMKDNMKFPISKYKYILFSLISMMLVILILGTKSVKSILGFEKCGLYYWIFLSFSWIIPIFISFRAMNEINREYLYRVSIEFVYDKYDIILSNSLCIKLSFTGFLVGVISGFTGIGGGILLCPILLLMGVNPITATSTSNFLIILNSSIIMFEFLLDGTINFKYGLVLSFFSGIGSFIGTILLHYILISTKRISMRIIPLIIVLIICCILMPSFIIYDIFHKNDQRIIDINFLCNSSD